MSDLHRRILRPGLDRELDKRGRLGFRSRKLDFSNKKEGSGSRKRENDSSEEHVHVKKASAAKLPPKHAMLEAFYEGLEAAISLLGIRRQICTFHSVCATVEATTQRRFLLRHLAQIKHILPEVLQLEYVRLFDADTRNKKWDLRISFSPMPAVEEKELSEEGRSAQASRKKPKVETVRRRQAFHARLLKFASTHPELDLLSAEFLSLHVRVLELHSQKEDDVPEYPLPERPLHCNSATKIAEAKVSEITMPAATTCIPLEINTTSHRLECPESKISAGTQHFYPSFRPVFSSKPSQSFIPKPLPLTKDSDDLSQVGPYEGPETEDLGSILPLPINRIIHRDVQTLTDLPAGTPHLSPSFRPFFSLNTQNSKSSQRLPTESSEHDVLPKDLPNPPVNSTPLKKRRLAKVAEEDDNIPAAQLSTPIKVMRICGASDTQSPSRSPHLSPSFMPRFSAKHVSSQSQTESPSLHQETVNPRDQTCGVLSTPVKSSLSKNFLNSPWVATPQQMSGLPSHESPCRATTGAADNTPVKSSIPVNPFKSPNVMTPAHNALTNISFSPSTPLSADATGWEGNINCNASLSQSASLAPTCNSPLLTPLKQATTIRSLKFNTPDTKASIPRSPRANFSTPSRSTSVKPSIFPSPDGSSGVNIPATPVMQTPVAPVRVSGFKEGKSTKRSKLNLGPLFAQNPEEEACLSGESPESLEVDLLDREVTGGDSVDWIPESSNAGPAEIQNLKKSLSSVSGEFSDADMGIIQSLPPELVHSVLKEEKKVSIARSEETMVQRRRQQMMAGIPQLFNQLRLIFQSSNRSVLPYKELVSKILSSNAELTDRGEVEERMKILVELAPDWISVNPSLSGDRLYRINKNIDVMGVRRRLLGAQ